MQDPVNLIEPSSGLMFWTLLLVGAAAVTGVYVLIRVVRGLRQHNASPVTHSPMAANVELLETEVAQLRSEVRNLEDAQDFTTNLLTQRPAANTPPLPRKLD